MASIKLLPVIHKTVMNEAIDVSIDMFFDPATPPDDDLALARAVMVALNTNRLALPDDTLPTSSPDRRGWWGDMDQQLIWGGPVWPLGCRLWLLERTTITSSAAKQGSTLQNAIRYINEALQPFVDAGICTTFEVNLSQTGLYQIEGTIVMYRGPKSSVALQYQDLWKPYGG